MTTLPTKTLHGLLLDTNFFNHLVDGKIKFDRMLATFSLFVTHIQHDEILAFKPKSPGQQDRKDQLLEKIGTIPDHILPTQSAIIGITRIEGAKLEGGTIYTQIFSELNKANSKRTVSNARDALIGEVAIVMRLELVTNDRNLKKAVKAMGGHVLDLTLHQGLINFTDNELE